MPIAAITPPAYDLEMAMRETMTKLVPRLMASRRKTQRMENKIASSRIVFLPPIQSSLCRTLYDRPSHHN